MARHILFFIHGMGTHDTGWHEAGWQALSRAWSEYDHLKARPIEDWIEPVPVVYDPVFETWRQRMREDFTAFRDALFGGGAGLSLAPEDAGKLGAVKRKVDRIGDWIGAGEPEFVWTHAMDVILYRFFTQIRMAVDVRVIRQIMERLERGDFNSWSVVGHSLGTSVSHNSLNSLYGEGLEGVEPLGPGETRPRVVMMVANVSRVLERDGAKVYDSLVKPGAANTGRLCGYYLNVRHKLDPFVHPRPFERDPWPDPATFSSDRYQHIRPGHILFSGAELPRVHDFDHYLVNPRVHVPLFRAVLGNIFIPDAEYQQARSDFDASQTDDAIGRIREALEKKLPAPGGAWDVFVDLIRKIRQGGRS